MPRPSRSIRTQAIILSRRDFGEADRLLTLLTPSRGKLRAIAKGARKPNAKLSGHVELFARSDWSAAPGAQPRHRDASRTDRARIWGLRDDLQRGAYASYAAELLDRFTADDEEEAGGLFALLDDTLMRIANARDPRLATRFYELALLNLVGFKPELSECVITRLPLLPEAQFFSSDEGGVVSRAGKSLSQSRLLPIELDTLKLLRHFAAQCRKVCRGGEPASERRRARARRAAHVGLHRAFAGAPAGERGIFAAPAGWWLDPTPNPSPKMREGLFTPTPAVCVYATQDEGGAFLLSSRIA